MDAKEKAKELIDKFLPHTKQFDARFGWMDDKEATKQCALIAVDEMKAILEKLRKPEYTTFIEWEQLKTKEEADTMDGYEYLDYLEKVKEEINF